MSRIIIVLVAILNVWSAQSQIDREFWFVAPEANQNHGDRPIYLKFATYSDPATISVSQPANLAFETIEIELSANSAYVIDLTTWIDTIENKPSNTILNYGIKITSTTDIMVYYEVSPSCNCNPDIFSLKGENALGTYFITPFQSFNSNSGDYYSGFNIVATQDNTNITIVPTQAIDGYSAGEEFTITLNSGETYFARGLNNVGNQNLSGSTIGSDKSIAVTVHEDSTSGPYGGCSDLIGDQMIPAQILGQEYIAIKGYLNGPDKVYVVAQSDNTEVQLNGTQYTILNSLETVEITLSDASSYIYTSEPSYVLHMSGFGCEVGQAILPPLDCTGSYDVSVIRSTNEFFALNILIPTGSEGDFYVEGSNLTINANEFNFVPGSNNNWKYAQLNLSNDVQINSALRIINSTERFHMGLIHGGATSGCRYGYFSDFGKFDSTFSAVSPICEGESIYLEGPSLNSATYLWSGPSGFSSTEQNPIIENVNTSNQGEYSLEITIDEACISTSSMTIDINPRPSDFDTSEINICDYATFDDLSYDFPNINFYESQDLLTPVNTSTPLNVGTYYAVQVNEYNCISENLIRVSLGCFPVIPSAFSPNNDGYNDHFNITYLYDIYDQHILKIYNRYGKLIFEGDNQKKWYGTSSKNNNQTVPTGTYFYYLSLNNEENDIITGWVYVNY